jgi:predicted nicotinamide N-methyase
MFTNKKVLEIGAGIGLCGVVAAGCGASTVFITDYSEVILENTALNVVLNRGTYLLDGSGSPCIPPEETCHTEVNSTDPFHTTHCYDNTMTFGLLMVVSLRLW